MVKKKEEIAQELCFEESKYTGGMSCEEVKFNLFTDIRGNYQDEWVDGKKLICFMAIL